MIIKLSIQLICSSNIQIKIKGTLNYESIQIEIIKVIILEMESYHIRDIFKSI